MRELLLTIKSLEDIDKNPDLVMDFFNRPEIHFEVFETVIQKYIIAAFDEGRLRNSDEMINKYHSICELLNDKFWYGCYPLHEAHFHKDFKAYCNCPFTCLTEIIDCLKKITEGN